MTQQNMRNRIQSDHWNLSQQKNYERKMKELVEEKNYWKERALWWRAVFQTAQAIVINIWQTFLAWSRQYLISVISFCAYLPIGISMIIAQEQEFHPPLFSLSQMLLGIGLWMMNDESYPFISRLSVGWGVSAGSCLFAFALHQIFP